ncbi:MAG: fibronectin type III domain-containing protein, partial [Eubacteriaceae bacterium]|nr:fibronectin type III domain-containing protein [Eubacteriaceae bacterium]
QDPKKYELKVGYDFKGLNLQVVPNAIDWLNTEKDDFLKLKTVKAGDTITYIINYQNSTTVNWDHNGGPNEGYLDFELKLPDWAIYVTDNAEETKIVGDTYTFAADDLQKGKTGTLKVTLKVADNVEDGKPIECRIWPIGTWNDIPYRFEDPNNDNVFKHTIGPDLGTILKGSWVFEKDEIYTIASKLQPGKNTEGLTFHTWTGIYFVSEEDWLLDSTGRYIYAQIDPKYLDLAKKIFSVNDNNFQVSVETIEKGMWINGANNRIYVHYNGDDIDIGVLVTGAMINKDSKVHWVPSKKGGDRVLRSDVSYHIANGYYNDLALVDIIVGEDTLLSISASAYVQEVTVLDGGRLNLSRVNYNVLNSLFTKWIGKLNLNPGAKVDFPVGSTSADIKKWLGNTVITGVLFFINGKASTLDPGPIVDTVKPIMSVNHDSPTSVKVSWTSVPGAASYNLYQSSSATGAFTQIQTGLTGNSFIVTGLSTGSYYYFKAEAVVGSEKIEALPIAVRARPLRPAFIKAATGSKAGQVVVTWDAVAQCDGYAIYYSTSQNGTYVLKTLIAGKNNTSGVVTGLRSGDTYYFKVVSYTQTSAAKIPSVYSGPVSAKAR